MAERLLEPDAKLYVFDTRHETMERVATALAAAMLVAGFAVIASISRGAEYEAALPTTIEVRFKSASPPRMGVLHSPMDVAGQSAAERVALLTTIPRSNEWLDAMVENPTIDFAAIAARENLSERHVRFLAPLVYLCAS